MNEAETRAELIDPALKAAGWGIVEHSRIRREVIAPGRLVGNGKRASPEFADYVLVYRGEKLAVIEAKKLAQGINDGYLTPFKVRQVETTLDEYTYTLEDELLEGEVDEEKVYTEADFNRIIEIEEWESYRVQVLMNEIDQNQKTLVFCASQPNPLLVAIESSLINRSFSRGTLVNSKSFWILCWRNILKKVSANSIKTNYLNC